jgi:hypothetical protein
LINVECQFIRVIIVQPQADYIRKDELYNKHLRQPYLTIRIHNTLYQARIYCVAISLSFY